MKKFLIAGSSLVAVGAASTAGAVDVTLGGSIDMSVEYGMKSDGASMAFTNAAASVSLNIAAAGTTDGGVKYGGSFTLATADELKFNFYDDNGSKKHFKYTVKNYTDLEAAAYNVSGGQKLDEDAIVAVKINSEWHNVSDNTRSVYGLPIMVSGGFNPMTNDNICKVAGRAANTVEAPLAAPEFVNSVLNNGNLAIPGASTGMIGVARANAAGNAITDVNYLAFLGAATPQQGYLPAGRLTQLEISADDTVAGAGAPGLAVNLVLTAGTSAAQSHNVGVSAVASANFADAEKGATDALDDEFTVYLADTDGDDIFINADGSVDFTVDGAGDRNHDAVTNAAVFAGPFAEVKMQSSTTKMVVGAVCLTGRETSDTAFYMDNASNVVTASGAKIFVDGGFGKMTLQTSDYAGKVSAIGNAGDAAGISADGLVVILEGSMMGATVYGAADLDGSLATVETVIGASFDLNGLSVAIDYESKPLAVITNLASGETSNVNSSAWDIGAGYSMGDITAGVALDSDGDFGASADMSLAGLNVGFEMSSRGTEAHKKTGLDYSVTAGTSVNGMSVSVAIDQDMKAAATVGYDIGDLNIYAGYDAADNGGKVGAKLSF